MVSVSTEAVLRNWNFQSPGTRVLSRGNFLKVTVIITEVLKIRQYFNSIQHENTIKIHWKNGQ
jgi:hypothetical protein